MLKSQNTAKLFWVIIFAFLSPSIYSQLRINEFMAANINANFDPSYNYVDWVELYNGTGSSIDLYGYSLTDDPADSRKYVITEHIYINSGSYLVISLDKQDYIRGAYSSIHTNFSLDVDGEFLGLYTSSGSPVDTFTFGQQVRNRSCGRLTSDINQWGYFEIPTPRATNYGTYLSHSQTAGEVSFSMVPGFYSGSVTLELIASNETDEIRYTLNGDQPVASSTRYTGPVTITESATIRAGCFASDKHPGPILSGTFFIDIATPNLPVVALSTDIENFEHWEYGIYVDGGNGISNPWCSPDKAVNWMRDWERPINFEFFTQEGEQQISQLVGTKIFGGCSRSHPIRSLALISRKDYGKKGLEHKFFVDKDVDEFKSLVLRNSGNDAGSTFLRDGFMQHIVKDRMDLDNQGYQPVLVYLNGEYFGLLNLREKMNEHYAESNHGADADIVDVINLSEYLAAGNMDAYNELKDYIHTHNLSDQAAFDHVASLVDVNSYLDYFLVNIYVGNDDWPQNNNKIWRERREGAKWRAFLFDTDQGFGYARNLSDYLAWATRDHVSTEIFRALLQNETCRNEFFQRFAAHLNTTFQPERILPVLDSLEALVSPHIPYQIATWRRPYSSWEYNHGVNEVMPEFAVEQIPVVQGWIKSYLGISSMYNLSVSSTGEEKGQVLVCEVDVPADYSGDHFGSIPVRLRAIPRHGFVFSGWTGDFESTQSEIWVDMDAPVSVTANFEPTSEITGLYINEIIASNIEGITDEYGEYEDWIEIYNSNDFPIDLAGLYISDSLPFLKQYQFPYGDHDYTTIPANGYKLLWADSDSKQGSLHLPFKLRRSGEGVYLSQQLGSGVDIIDSVTYSEQYSDVSLGRDPDELEVWKWLNPTPEAENIDVQLENIFINEFMASNNTVFADEDGVYEDWIEIYNANDFAVDIAGMFISDDINEICKFRVPTTQPDLTIIPAGGFLIFWADDSTEQGTLHLNFGLRGSGEQIILTQPNGLDIIDSLTYSDLISDAPYGRVVDGTGHFSYMVASPGATNEQLDYTGLYINEFMSTNRSVIQDNYGEYDDWFELYNDNSYSLDVAGLFLSDDINERLKFRIHTRNSDSTTIPPKGHLVFWADDSVEQGILHTSFKLSGSGEQIVISSPTGEEIIDSITYGNLINDTPFGRMGDGNSAFGYMEPTPGASNIVDSTSNLFINEVLASNSQTFTDNFGEYDDWIELYNANPFSVDVGGMFITDDYGADNPYRIPATSPGLTTIPPGGYLLLWADDSVEQGVLHVNFKLNQLGEQLVLLKRDGLSIIDSLSYQNAIRNVSYGRKTDGSPVLAVQMPSPNASNRVQNYTGIKISEVMSSDHTGYPDEFGEYGDWIELYNSSDRAINIAGMLVTDSLARPFRHIIPATNPDITTIQPHEYLVLFADNQEDQGANHLGFGLRESGEQVGLFSLDGTLIDSLVYPNQYNNFSYSLIDDEIWLSVPPTPEADNIVPTIGNLFINEFMSDNENRVEDDFEEYDDWIEIYNTNAFPVDLGGMYISDTLAENNKYRIPSNDPDATTIPAFGYKIIWADNDSEQGPLHANFKLGRDGEEIILSGYDYRVVIDEYHYLYQHSNFSSGRLHELGEWVDIPPSPEAPNYMPDLSGIYINEIMANNGSVIADNYGEYDDWIEIYNGGNVAVDLGGLHITDSIKDPSPFRISSDEPAITTIYPGEYKLLWADDSTDQGILHTNFKLSSSGEQVALFAYDGVTLLDSVSYIKAVSDFSYGRATDGNLPWQVLNTPSPLRQNEVKEFDEPDFTITNFSYKLYPNPASEHLTISMHVGRACKVILKVYDYSGNLVATPVHDYYIAGDYDISWNLTSNMGASLNKGIYYFTLESKWMFVRDKLVIIRD